MATDAIVALLRERTGLNTATLGPRALERACERRMKLLDITSPDAYAALLRDDTKELQELVEDVVVPETWFLRDLAAYRALSGWVKTEWLAAPRNHALEILSIPCSTGEEPYSIAMTLRDVGFDSKTASVLGVDISQRSLATAARGVYRSNSFRGRDLSYRELYFDEKKDGYHIAERIRDMVKFRQGNVLTEGSIGRPFDVVFCRNLLIYFDPPTQRAAMDRLDALLRPDGLLFLGSAETFLAQSLGYESLGVPMSFAFRKIEPKPKTPAPKKKPLSAKPVTFSERRRAPLQRTPPRVVEEKVDLLADAEALANRGRLDEAAALCDRYIRERGPTARAYLLLGIASETRGAKGEAVAYFRKALYLDPTSEEARAHLALVVQRGKSS